MEGLFDVLLGVYDPLVRSVPNCEGGKFWPPFGVHPPEVAVSFAVFLHLEYYLQG